MRDLVYVYPKQGMKFVDIPEPEVSKPNEVKIKIEYAAICGSDIHIVNGSFDYQFRGLGFPEGASYSVGHEAAGTVVAVGDEVTVCKVGDKVTFNSVRACGKCHYCRNGQENLCENQATGFGGMRDYALVPEDIVFVLPENVDTKLGCLSEPTSVAMACVDEADIKPGQSVAIIGAGPIGMLALQIARQQGAYPITVFDITDEKLAIAKKLGADYTVNSLKEDAGKTAIFLNNNKCYEKVLECSGSTKVLDMAMEIVAKGGHIVVTSAYPEGAHYDMNLELFFGKCLTMSQTYCSADMFERSVNFLNRIDVDNTITAVYPLDQYEEGFKAHLSGKHVKVVFKVD